MAKHKDAALASKRIDYKLRIAFYLSCLPVLVLIYFVFNYVRPNRGLGPDIVLYLLATAMISSAGFLLIRQVLGHIAKVTREAKLMASGDTRRRIDAKNQDEVSDLSLALNQLVANIRTDMDELKTYGAKTVEMNLEIQRRVFLLSSLLEISSLISQGAKVETIFRIAVEKSRMLCNSDNAYLLFRETEAGTFYMKAADGQQAERLREVNVLSEDKSFSALIRDKKPLILDNENKLSAEASKKFHDNFGLENSLALPISLKDKVIGILGIGNNQESFVYDKDAMGLLDVLSRQVSIAVENEFLVHRIEKLEIKDPLTGLYNEIFIRNCLQEEIRRAAIYQRPCSLVLLNADNFRMIPKPMGDTVLKKLAVLIKESITDVDRAARTGGDEFAVVLPEKNKRQGQRIADDIRKKIESVFSREAAPLKNMTVSGGVSENPLDGIDPQELMLKAREFLKSAKAQGKNRVA